MKKRVLTLAIFFLIFLSLCLPHFSDGIDEKPTEYQVKAAFMYNFLKFIRWPDGYFKEKKDFKICVYGKDPFGGAIDDIGGKVAFGKPISIKRIGRNGKTTGCNLIFISSSETKRVEKILSAIKGPVLTISDIEGFIEKGGIIEFVMEGKNVRFKINREVAINKGLWISSRLLWLARNRPGREK
ncbi:MAG: YfiR family protein [Nitrospirae bacterium]|nr:MAG: YfiR family protein [Nitrospirota bacterium]